jgi:hypothetical protein
MSHSLLQFVLRIDRASAAREMKRSRNDPCQAKNAASGLFLIHWLFSGNDRQNTLRERDSPLQFSAYDSTVSGACQSPPSRAVTAQ